jgi:hypothetical protein
MRNAALARISTIIIRIMQLPGGKQLWLCGLLALCVVLPRSLLIDRAHSPCVDADEHLSQGLSYLRCEPHPQAFYDPPLGKMLLALPIWLAGARTEFTTFPGCPGAPPRERRTVIYRQKLAPETLTQLVAAWKSLLFVPAVMIAFAWCARLYGTRAAWLAAAMLVFDPNFAAHVPVAALDSLAASAAVTASFLAWRYVEQPKFARLAGAAAATAAALLVKHTLLLLPIAFVLLAVAQWFIRPWLGESSFAALRATIRPRLNALAAGALLLLLFLWALALFDVSRPDRNRAVSGISYTERFDFRRSILAPAMSIRWPAGVYFGSVVAAREQSAGGHQGYLFGEFREHGWAYYFPAVAMLKLPLGTWLLAILALVSFIWIKPRWDELSIALPAAACATLLIVSGYNVGFRHALPAYALLILLVSRCVASGAPRISVALAWLGTLAAATHALSYHPDYLAYTNGAWRRPYLEISDSNIDWGQAIKEARNWIDSHARGDRQISIDLFNDVADPAIERYLHGRALLVCEDDPAPTRGILIVSPCHLVGLYSSANRYPREIRDARPIDQIGHGSLLVYDLDALQSGRAK